MLAFNFRTHKQQSATIILSSLVLFFFSIQIDAKPLFLLAQKADLTKKQSNSLNKINSAKTTRNVQVMKIDYDALKNDTIDLNISEKVTIKLKMQRSSLGKGDAYTLTGKGSKDLNYTTIVRQGTDITADIWYDGKLYRVRPISGGLHALIEVNLANFPSDHPPSFNKIEKAPHGIFAPQNKDKRDAGSCSADVIVAYTAQADSLSGNITSLIQLAIDEANQSYINSGIGLKLNLVKTVKVNYNESANSYDKILSDFAGNGDGQMDEIHSLRDQYGADICILIMNKSDYCGLADAILANRSTAFAIVHYDCATGYYSFAHEIGHLFGARHNTEADASSTPFAYGHGYQ